jgi:hypothetical protein
MGFTRFYGTWRNTRDFLSVSNEICTINMMRISQKIQTSIRSFQNKTLLFIQRNVCPAKSIIRTCIQPADIVYPWYFPFGYEMWGSASMRDFTVTAKISENRRTRVSLREYYEYFFFLRKYMFNAIWYGGLLQIREHTREFYKSKQQQIKFKRDSYKALTESCKTKAQMQSSSRDKILNFTLIRFPAIEEVQ